MIRNQRHKYNNLIGEHTSRYNPENPSGFYELYINGAQPSS